MATAVRIAYLLAALTADGAAVARDASDVRAALRYRGEIGDAIVSNTG